MIWFWVSVYLLIGAARAWWVMRSAQQRELDAIFRDMPAHVASLVFLVSYIVAVPFGPSAWWSSTSGWQNDPRPSCFCFADRLGGGPQIFAEFSD